jgi:hypothetical protein
MRAHAAVMGWMPPMLNIPLPELMSRGPKQLFAEQHGPGVDECHCVLKLIAKAKCTT